MRWSHERHRFARTSKVVMIMRRAGILLATVVGLLVAASPIVLSTAFAGVTAVAASSFGGCFAAFWFLCGALMMLIAFIAVMRLRLRARNEMARLAQDRATVGDDELRAAV